MTMRAFAVDEFGATGSIHELPIPEPAEGEVRVGIHAAGVNGDCRRLLDISLTEGPD